MLCLISLVMLLQDNDGRTPLHMTAIHGRFTRAETLIAHGGHPHSQVLSTHSMKIFFTVYHAAIVPC